MVRTAPTPAQARTETPGGWGASKPPPVLPETEWATLPVLSFPLHYVPDTYSKQNAGTDAWQESVAKVVFRLPIIAFHLVSKQTIYFSGSPLIS